MKAVNHKGNATKTHATNCSRLLLKVRIGTDNKSLKTCILSHTSVLNTRADLTPDYFLDCSIPVKLFSAAISKQIVWSCLQTLVKTATIRAISRLSVLLQ